MKKSTNIIKLIRNSTIKIKFKREIYLLDFYFIIFAIEVYKAEIIILGVIVIKKKKEI